MKSKNKTKKSVEELLGIMLITIILALALIYYFFGSFKIKTTDFEWKKYHLEYIVQVFLNKEISYEVGCSISVLELINNLADSLSKLPSCYTESVDIRTAKIMNLNILEDSTITFFNRSKSDLETFKIVYKIGEYSKEINVKGIINQLEFDYDYCKEKSFLKSKYVLSSEIINLDGEIVFYYCRLII